MSALNSINHWSPSEPDEPLFEKIAQDLLTQGYSINPSALPALMTQDILSELDAISNQFVSAGIGREKDLVLNPFVRSDSVCWIEEQTAACQDWNQWMQRLQVYLNRRLFLGLFAFESHFAHYSPGDFYKRHYDAFKGGNNRILSVVAYFNAGWTSEDGGELVLYENDEDTTGIKVLPNLGSLVVFLSEEFPHEVLTARRDRYSIAGWFRPNPGADRLLELPDSIGSPV